MFKTFGCTSLIYIPLQNRTNLDFTAERGSLVGLSESEMCYKIYVNSTKSMIKARDVTFIEDADEKRFIDEDRLDNSEKGVDLSTTIHHGSNKRNKRAEKVQKRDKATTISPETIGESFERESEKTVEVSRR